MTYRTLSARDLAVLDATCAGAGVYGRDDLCCVVGRGKHHVRFLHALLTAPFEGRAAGDWFEATATDAKGRMVAYVRCLARADSVELWVERALAQALIDHLLAHRVAERLTLEIDDERALMEVLGPGAAAFAGLLPAESFAYLDCIGRLGGPALPNQASPWPLPRVSASLARAELPTSLPALLAAGAGVGCLAAGEALRVGAGLPRLKSDLHDGSTPLELAHAGAVSLQKGCYLGQEALAMQAWRGQLRRALCWLRPEPDAAGGGSATPPPGAALYDGRGRKVGNAGAGIQGPGAPGDGAGLALGLGVVQRKAASPGASLTWRDEAHGAGLVRVVDTVQAAAFGGAAAEGSPAP